MIHAFENELLSNLVPVKKGLDTGNNDYFLKYWHEVSYNKIGIRKSQEDFISTYKWAPHDKGGAFSRWYGNNEWVINWENDAHELRNSKANIRSEQYYFQKAITWNSLASGKISFRLSDNNAISNTAGSSLYPSGNDICMYLGILNSKVAQECLNIVSPTLNYSAGPVGLIPIIQNHGLDCTIKQNISISKQDWDAHETSWDFEENPLLAVDEETYIDNINHEIERHEKETGERICIDPAASELDSLEWRMEQYKQKWEHLFMQLHENEEELNRQFIDIYGLQDELTPDVPLDEITILQQGEVSIE